MARVAPRSIPAGLSHSTQSNLPRSSVMTRLTPSSVSASLSRVCDAGSSHRFSRRLSRMSACEQLRDALHDIDEIEHHAAFGPHHKVEVAKSDIEVDNGNAFARCASAAPSAAVDVVLPTPPLPDVTTKTLAILKLLRLLVQRCDFQNVAVEPGLGRPIAQRFVDVFRGLVVAVDRQQLGFDALAVNPRRRVAVDAGHRAASERAVNMDRSSGDDFGARSDRPEHRHIAVGKHHRLARTHRTFESRDAGRGLASGLFGSLRARMLVRPSTAAAYSSRRAESIPSMPRMRMSRFRGSRPDARLQTG